MKSTDSNICNAPVSLKKCSVCPRDCNADRFSKTLGYCNSDASYNIGSICIHNGEEPVISGRKGICNVFFSHCNMQCVFCQNYQISDNNAKNIEHYDSPGEVICHILELLEGGCHALGFVSPSHCFIQMLEITNEVHKAGKHPIIVYNSNAYDKVETLKALEGIVDVYLPDLKYADQKIGLAYSDVPDYPETAFKAVKEMYRQKGSTLICNENNEAESGLIIRHLVLPGHANDSIAVLRRIAEEISTAIPISLMSQYHPTTKVKSHPILHRTITKKEYLKVVKEMESLGFYKGWIQDYDSPSSYRPDFFREHPFE